ncbi:MAG: FeoA domain-containing protein [Culicoidibacterales bacterium]
MKRYQITGIMLPDEAKQQLQAIGVDVGVEVELKNADDDKHICFVTVEESMFCLRKSTMKYIELVEIK